MVRSGRTALIFLLFIFIVFAFQPRAHAASDPCSIGSILFVPFGMFSCFGDRAGTSLGSSPTQPTATAPVPASTPAKSTPASNVCFNDDGSRITCPNPTSAVPSMSADTTISPLNPKCKELISHPLFRGTKSNFSTLNNDECQAYMDLEKYNKTGSPAGITMLNPTFAKNLAAMLNAAKNNNPSFFITISSGYRSEQKQKEVNPHGFGGDAALSKHTQGLAADLNYPDAVGSSKSTCDTGSGSAAYSWVDENAKRFQIDLYNNLHSRVKGECSHVEDTSGAKGTGPGGSMPSGAGTGPAAQSKNEGSPLPSKFVNEYGEECRRVAGRVVNCDSKKAGLFGGDFGTMMQMMMGMQIGQGLGSLLGDMFKSDSPNKNGNANPYSTPFPPPTHPPPPPPPNSGGTDPIDDLLNALGTSTTPTGEIVPPPPPDANDSFVTPRSGITPLTARAHFTSGTSCSDAFYLSWGDGYHDVMPHIPPTGSDTCTTRAQVNDISHAYNAVGTYMVTLRQGTDLSSIATTSVIVSGTSTTPTSDVPGPTVTGTLSTSTASSTESSLLGSVLASISNVITQFGEAIIGIFVH